MSLRTAARWLLGLLFIAAGLNHFRNPGFYLPMMPPGLPAPLGLVYVSGVLEVVGGAMVFVPRWRPMAGWGLIVLLIAVFPANITMALHPELFPGLSPVLLWARLPLQGVLMAWAYWATRPDGAALKRSSLS